MIKYKFSTEKSNDLVVECILATSLVWAVGVGRKCWGHGSSLKTAGGLY